MKRAKQLGTVTFDMNSFFIEEEFEPDNVLSETFMSAAGTHIVYEAPIHTPYITLTSGEYGRVTEAQRDAIMTMYASIGTTYTLTYKDDSTVTVRFAREKKPSFTPLFEGSTKFKAVIPLAKI